MYVWSHKLRSSYYNKGQRFPGLVHKKQLLSPPLLSAHILLLNSISGFAFSQQPCHMAGQNPAWQSPNFDGQQFRSMSSCPAPSQKLTSRVPWKWKAPSLMVPDDNFNGPANSQALRLPKSVKLSPNKRVLHPTILQPRMGRHCQISAVLHSPLPFI